MKELTKLIKILSSYGLWNSESEINKLAEEEEARRRFPGELRLVPGVWDPELGDEEEGESNPEEEEEDLGKKHFGANSNDLTFLALDLSSYISALRQGFNESLEKIGGKYGFKISLLGSGAYRTAFSIGNDLIIKISNRLGGEDGARMNREDYRLGTDPEIGGIFPRAYDKAPYGKGFNWVTLERVKEISHRHELAHFSSAVFWLILRVCLILMLKPTGIWYGEVLMKRIMSPYPGPLTGCCARRALLQ